MTTTKISMRWGWTMDTFRFIRFEKLTWAFHSGELTNEYIWPSRLTYTHMNIQRQKYRYIIVHKQSITLKDWLPVNLFAGLIVLNHHSLGLFFIKVAVMFSFVWKIIQKTSVRIINIVIMKCMISWLIRLNSCSDTSELFIV